MEMKVPGGKLARLSVKRNGLPKVVLSGDFFIYPDEGILIIEKTLAGLAGDEPLEYVESSLKMAIKESGIELIGLDEHTIALLYKGATRVEGPGP
jgi:lipoate-protein ligase A